MNSTSTTEARNLDIVLAYRDARTYIGYTKRKKDTEVSQDLTDRLNQGLKVLREGRASGDQALLLAQLLGVMKVAGLNPQIFNNDRKVILKAVTTRLKESDWTKVNLFRDACAEMGMELFFTDDGRHLE